MCCVCCVLLFCSWLLVEKGRVFAGGAEPPPHFPRPIFFPASQAEKSPTPATKQSPRWQQGDLRISYPLFFYSTMSSSHSSSRENFSYPEVSTRRVAANVIMMSTQTQRPPRRTMQRSSRPLIQIPRRKFHPNRRRSKSAVALPSAIILGFTHFILFFQKYQHHAFVVAFGDHDEFPMLTSVSPDRISTDTELEQQLPNVINSIPSGQSWEDDDDDIYEAVVAAAHNEIPSNGADIVQVQIDEEGKGENDVVILDEKYLGYNSEWPDKVVDNEIDEAASEDAKQTDEVVDEVTSGHSNDEEDDTLESSPVQSYDASADVILAVSEIPPEKDFVPTLDGTIDVGSVPIDESPSVEQVHDLTVALSDGDDDDADGGVESENAVDTDAKSANKFGGSGQVEDSKAVLPAVDNEGNDGVIDDSGNRLDDNDKVSEEMDDSEEFHIGATHIVAEELHGIDSVSTEYHRSRSIEGDGIGGNDEIPVKENETTADINGAENAKNESNVNSLPNGGNVNNITNESPNEEDPNQIPPIQGWDETADGSFLEMMQSTFNVLLLAAFLTSLLIFRKRVLLRLNTDPTLSMTDAVREELVNFVLKIKSWVENAAGGSAVRESGATIEGRGSFRAETTPLSTAVDEEWGWGDGDVGQRLELSAMGGDKEKEDEDLALALAMSLSESHNERDDFNSSLTPPTPSANKKFNKKSPPAKSSNSSSRFNPSTTREETHRKAFTPQPSLSTTSGGGESIEDLLGHIGGNGRPMIMSLGHKLQKTSKPNQNQQHLRSGDIFDSMGLSNYPSTAATASKPTARPASTASGTKKESKVTAPKIAPVQSLIADTIDADDSWADDGDLDDLLDD